MNKNKYQRILNVFQILICRLISFIEQWDIDPYERRFFEFATRYGCYRERTPPMLTQTLPPAHTDTPPSSVGHSPRLTQIREINKTKPNITKTNITKPTELSESAEDGGGKERNSFLNLKENWFKALKNEKGFEEEDISLSRLELKKSYIIFNKIYKKTLYKMRKK